VNPGSVRRVKDHPADQMVTSKSYERLCATTLDEEYLLRGILLDLSVRDFADLHSQPSARALTKSAVDQAFIERSAERLKEFEARRYDDVNFVALFMDGKYLVGQQIVLVLGVTLQGRQVPLVVLCKRRAISICPARIYSNNGCGKGCKSATVCSSSSMVRRACTKP
jgi:hypothetical protein